MRHAPHQLAPRLAHNRAATRNAAWPFPHLLVAVGRAAIALFVRLFSTSRCRRLGAPNRLPPWRSSCTRPHSNTPCCPSLVVCLYWFPPDVSPRTNGRLLRRSLALAHLPTRRGRSLRRACQRSLCPCVCVCVWRGGVAHAMQHSSCSDGTRRAKPRRTITHGHGHGHGNMCAWPWDGAMLACPTHICACAQAFANSRPLTALQLGLLHLVAWFQPHAEVGPGAPRDGWVETLQTLLDPAEHLVALACRHKRRKIGRGRGHSQRGRLFGCCGCCLQMG